MRTEYPVIGRTVPFILNATWRRISALFFSFELSIFALFFSFELSFLLPFSAETFQLSVSAGRTTAVPSARAQRAVDIPRGGRDWANVTAWREAATGMSASRLGWARRRRRRLGRAGGGKAPARSFGSATASCEGSSRSSAQAPPCPLRVAADAGRIEGAGDAAGRLRPCTEPARPNASESRPPRPGLPCPWRGAPRQRNHAMVRTNPRALICLACCRPSSNERGA